MELKIKLSDDCSVSQAEVAAIKEAVDWLLTSAIPLREINIYSDSQAISLANLGLLLVKWAKRQLIRHVDVQNCKGLLAAGGSVVVGGTTQINKAPTIVSGIYRALSAVNLCTQV